MDYMSDMSPIYSLKPHTRH